MINEISQLADALDRAQIVPPKYYREYLPIPNISDKAPCIRILISHGTVQSIESVGEENGKIIRKFGNNQGTFPAMNIAPLFRLSGEEEKKLLARMIKEPESYLDEELVQSWLTEKTGLRNFLINSP